VHLLNIQAIEHIPGVSEPERIGDRDESTTGFVDAVVVGILQAASIVPGLSRTGATVAAAMFRGITRDGAVRLSFLLAVPVIAGATCTENCSPST
jgi:undecaprenyl-diphosphatase